MRSLHPDRLPAGLRTLGHSIFGQRARRRIASSLQDLANLQYRFGPAARANEVRLGRLRDSRSGTCVIIGNGPSMAGFDVDRLRGVDTFCLNRGYLLWEGTGRRPTWLVTVNDLVIEQFRDEIAAIEVPRFLPWEHAASLPATTTDACLTMRWKPGFATDLRQGLWAGGTVTYVAMQVAFHLGYDTVALIGVDHRFSFEGNPNETLVAAGPDRNHFTGSYFDAGTAWHAPDLATSEQAYAMARDVFHAAKRRIFDATEGGALDIFEKRRLEDVLAAGENSRSRGAPM